MIRNVLAGHTKSRRLSLLLGFLTLVSGSVAVADDDGMTEIWSVARGGQLYDNWYQVIGQTPPEATHPAYPETGKQKGASTWRCKECHGWDYRGAAGAYGSGSHFTGIKGIRDMVGKDPATIASIVRGDTHGYTGDMLSDVELRKLALFVSLGQTDMDLWVDRQSNRSRGSAKNGAAAYQTICAVCHGFDGKLINFKTAEKPEYIGTIANKNPWEFIHKTRFGQPGIPMIALITLPMEEVADILAYSQTLPVK